MTQQGGLTPNQQEMEEALQTVETGGNGKKETKKPKAAGKVSTKTESRQQQWSAQEMQTALDDIRAAHEAQVKEIQEAHTKQMQELLEAKGKNVTVIQAPSVPAPAAPVIPAPTVEATHQIMFPDQVTVRNEYPVWEVTKVGLIFLGFGTATGVATAGLKKWLRFDVPKE